MARSYLNGNSFRLWIALVLMTLVLCYFVKDFEQQQSENRSKSVYLKILSSLPVSVENNSQPFNRVKDFGNWLHSGTCKSTRIKVLTEESIVPMRHNQDCKRIRGEWHSIYDGSISKDPTKNAEHPFQIEHTVPIKEVWQSGAMNWSHQDRVRYMNDLGFSGTLVAVDALSNQAKGEREPQDWIPSDEDKACAYIATWIAVKYRWHLNVDLDEKHFLANAINHCGIGLSTELPQRVHLGSMK